MNVLKTMRGMKLLKGLLWIVVISFVAAIFTLWGGGLDYEKSGRSLFGADYAVRVGRQTISPEIYKLQYRFYERQMRDMLGNNFKASFLQGAPARMADDMANQLILAGMAKDYGLTVSDVELVAYIQKAYRLTGSKDYSDLLSRLGVGAADFQEFIRLQLLVEKLRGLLANSTFVSDEELLRLYKEQNERYKAMIAIVPFGGFQTKVPAVTDAELKARFEKEKAGQTLPERRGVDYLRITEGTTRDLVTVSDSQIKAYYDDHKDQFSIPADQRRASHILVKVDPKAPAADLDAARKKAQEALDRAKRGEDFAKLAGQYSQDGTSGNGGDLGWFARDRMVKPFSDAAFDQCQSVGQIVGPVQTQFGFHVIKLTGLGGGLKPFDEVKQQIRQTLVLQDPTFKQAQKEAGERVAKELEAAKDQAAFKALADKYKLTISSMPHPVSQQDPIGPLGSDPKLMAAVFKAPANTWEPFDLPKESGSSKVFFKVTSIVAAHPVKLEDVKQDLEQAIKKDKAFEMAHQAAVTLLGSSPDAAALQANAQKSSYPARPSESLTSKDYIPNVGKNAAIARAFLAARTGQAVGPIKFENGYLVAYVTERTSADMAKFSGEKADLRQNQGEEYARQVMDDYTQRERAALEKKKAISVNSVLIKQFEPTGSEGQP
jgi:peptidyl-prolyl cis-trans isomerase D